MPLSLKLESVQAFLGFKVKLNKEIVVDVSGKETALVHANCSWNVLLFRVLRLIDVALLTLGLDSAFLELQLEGPDRYFRGSGEHYFLYKGSCTRSG